MMGVMGVLSSRCAGASSGPLDDHRDALADADAHRAQRVARAAAAQFMGGGQHEAGAAHAERVAERDGAAIGVDVRRVVGKAELAQDRERLGGEGFVKLDHRHLGERQAGALEQAAGRGHRADAHDARGDAGAGHRDDAGERRQAVRGGGRLRGDQRGGGAVVDARGVAGGHRAALAERRRQGGEALEGGLRAGVLVGVDAAGLAALSELDRDDLPGEAAGGVGRGGALLGA
jgi:hypothetical protein